MFKDSHLNMRINYFVHAQLCIIRQLTVPQWCAVVTFGLKLLPVSVDIVNKHIVDLVGGGFGSTLHPLSH